MPGMHGILKVIAGPMACGKTEELFRLLRRAEIANQRTLLFKPKRDTRSKENQAASRCGLTYDAIAVVSSNEILEYLDKIDATNSGQIVTVIGIEEMQFFNIDELLPVIRILLRRGKQVIICGLDQDFLGEPFETTARLMAIADKVLKLSAVCVKCGKDAVMSQKLINGKPALRNSDRIEVGGDEKYFAVCRDCHIIPD